MNPLSPSSAGGCFVSPSPLEGHSFQGTGSIGGIAGVPAVLAGVLVLEVLGVIVRQGTVAG